MPTRLVFNKTLDVRPDRLDLRDLPYHPPLISLPPRFPTDGDVATFLPQYTGLQLVLDQGQEGACTGFGLAAVVNYLRFMRQLDLKGKPPQKLSSVSPHLLYELARLYDEWPGEDYEGSSCRGALKGWHKHGVCENECWPKDSRQNKKLSFEKWREKWQQSARATTLGVYYRINKNSVVDMQAAIRQIGAIYVSATVHEGWDKLKGGETTHAGLVRIRRMEKPKDAGGHAFALVGYNEDGFVVQNSWGPKWGTGGFALLPYAEWVQYGDDAWCVALGVPAQVASPPTMVRGHNAALAMVGSPAALAAATPFLNTGVSTWDPEKVLDHTLVTGNDGFVIRRKVDLGDSASTVDHLARILPQASGMKKLVIYAHGGLNSEDASLKRIAAMGPYFEANGIYPIFLTWKTGPLETLCNILVDTVKPLSPPSGSLMDRIANAWDRTVEVAAANGGVKSMWREMKENAELGAEAGRGLKLLAGAFKGLSGMEIHAIGHSAGSIVLAYLLPLLKNGPAIETCTLWAPAATVELANASYAPAIVDRRVKHLLIENMSNRRELNDHVGKVYRKSLLYLVSRALEDAHKKPLIGLDAVYEPKLTGDAFGSAFDGELGKWRTACKSARVSIVARDEETVTNGITRAPIAHGSFDNDLKSANAAIERILGGAPKVKVTRLDY